ncbi:recombinase family protein [Salinicoccus albus]|uniref:recombinase family protein n=1 Tax=Salinicoccus albus TaxID=418756 RepID=UPI00036678F9|nr:recombinase family protein [Salinicoccus albus]
MKYGYTRPVDLYDEISEQQLKLESYADRLFTEAHSDSKKRYELEKLLKDTISPGDELFVTDLCILADSTKQLVDIVNDSERKALRIHVLNIDVVIDPSSQFSFHQVLYEISSFQSDIVKFRTKRGINQAAKGGKQMGRPRRNDENIKRAVEMYMSKKYTLDEIKEATRISRATLYRHLER